MLLRGVIFVAIMSSAALPASAARKYWENGTFDIPAPSPGGFALIDTGLRYGEWRVVGQAGNVSWTTGAYVHDGFNFVGPGGTGSNWVNLAAISRTATGIAHIPVPTAVGSSYILSFEVGNVVDPSGFYGSSSTVNVYENSRFVMSATNSGGAGTSTENWKHFTVTFRADAPWTTIAFINGDSPGDMNCGIGDTSLAPAPSSAAARHTLSTSTGLRP